MPMHWLVGVAAFGATCAAVAAGLGLTLGGLSRLERVSCTTAPPSRRRRR